MKCSTNVPVSTKILSSTTVFSVKNYKKKYNVTNLKGRQ